MTKPFMICQFSIYLFRLSDKWIKLRFFFYHHHIDTKFVPLHNESMINLRWGTCGTHKMSSPIPSKFFPCAREKNWTFNCILKEPKSLTIWTNPFRTYLICKWSKTWIPSLHLPHKVKNPMIVQLKSQVQKN